MVHEEDPRPMILVVDDAPENIDVLHGLLGQCYKVKAALNGEKALSICSGPKPPDLILLDIVMPGIDGYEVCRRLKADHRTAGIPVIFITVRDHEADELYGLSLGAVDYITKPFSPPIVKARVRTHLGLKQAREELERQNQQLREAARLREAVEQITRHDLKNPLQAIMGNLDLLLRQGLEAGHAHKLEAARRACYRMLDLINLSLDTYQIESHIYTFKPSDVDLWAVIQAVREELLEAAQQKGVALEIELVGDTGLLARGSTVSGERLLCYSMLANLIKNAVEASPSGEKVWVTIQPGGGEVKVAIANTGAVPQEVRQDFFAKYITHGKPGGTGLGTYSAWLISQLHGGGVEMQTSDAQDTTTVTVTLPVMAA